MAGNSAAGGTDLRDRPTLQADCSDCRRGDGHGEREEDNAHDQRGREDHLRSDVSFQRRNDGLSDYGASLHSRTIQYDEPTQPQQPYQALSKPTTEWKHTCIAAHALPKPNRFGKTVQPSDSAAGRKRKPGKNWAQLCTERRDGVQARAIAFSVPRTASP